MAIDYIWPQTDQNITFLPLSNPLCANETCLAFVAAENASQTRISWGSQFLYGHYVLLFWGTILGLFVLAGFARRLEYFHASRSNVYAWQDRSTSGEKLVALWRSVAYRRASGPTADWKKLPSLGLGLLVLASIVFAVLICFVQHPYYRDTRGYGSPPLGVRAGLAGTAMTPITVALSGKYNLVTLLTGISHEKLNFMHRWCGMIYLFFGIVHTVPFLIQDSTTMSGGLKRLYYQFYYPGSYEYTGIAPLAVLVFLCAFSNPWARSLCYELFVHSHIAAAIVYLGTMFWHTNNTMDSWIYLWATVAIWVVQLAARAWHKTAMFEVNEQYRTALAIVEILDDEAQQATMLRIATSIPLVWTPGQHIFVRFPSLALLDNHPFTIASIPSRKKSERSSDYHMNDIVFLVRPYGGVTKRLLKHARNNGMPKHTDKSSRSKSLMQTKIAASLQIKLDGPYGGLEQHRVMHKLYDHIILVAGGGGISAILPWLSALSQRIADPDEACRVQRVNLIWCIRHLSARAWVEEELHQSLRRAGGSGIHVDIYVTGEQQPNEVVTGKDSSEVPDSSDSIEPEKGDGHKGASAQVEPEDSSTEPRVHFGRPFIPSVLSEMVSERRTMILGCGPESLKIDLSNTAARMQRRVLQNSSDEISLHTETFGW